MSKHLCEALELVIDKSWSENEAQLRKAEIDDRLSDMRHAFQARVPMQGLHAPKINGEVRTGKFYFHLNTNMSAQCRFRW